MDSGKELAAETRFEKRLLRRRGRPRSSRGRLSWGRLSWMMLDGVLCERPDEDSVFLPGTEGFTSKGEKITVNFRVAAPPEIARLLYKLYLNPETPSSSSEVDYGGSWLSQARAVAAHRDCILLCFIIMDDPDPFSFNDERGEYFTEPETREELFVFQSFPGSRLKLINLPRCINTDPTMTSNVGIRCSDDGEFVVAQLAVTPKIISDQSDCPVTAELCRLFGTDGTWRTTKSVPIHNAEGVDHLIWWVTDAVIAFGSYICWVDYLRGILFYDVSNLNPELKYVPLPVNPYEGNLNTEFDSRGPLSAYRSLCVTEDGNAIKFVDVSSSKFWFYGRRRHPSDYAISSWKMDGDSFEWIPDGRMEEDHYFALTKQLNLPLAPLEFPLVDRKDSQTIYCMLKPESCVTSKIHLVAVKMSSKLITAMPPYTYGSSERDMYSSTTSFNLFYCEPFLHCDFSQFPDLHVSKARDREDAEGLTAALKSSTLLP